MKQNLPMGPKDVWATGLGVHARRSPIAQGRRDSELDPRQRAGVHRSRHQPTTRQRRVATEFARSERHGLQHMEHPVAEACSKPHQSINALKKSLTKAWNNISQDVIDRAVDDFPKRLKKCIEADGGHFENN